MALHADRVKMTVTGTPGTGTVTLNAASTGYRSFATAYGADATVDVLFEDGSAWETATNCAYTNSGTTLSRGTFKASSTGTVLSLTSSATASVAPLAAFGNEINDKILQGPEIAVTTTANATIGRWHYCTGTSADYTVTLPAAASCSGKYIGFRMGPIASLSKLVTLDGNASEKIDDETTRIMWAGETAILYCDGSNWFKVAGKSRPMVALAAPSANTTIVYTNPATRINLNTAISDPTGVMCDTANNEIVVRRPGTYRLTPITRISNATAAISRMYQGAWRIRSAVETQWVVQGETAIVTGSYAYSSISIAIPCNAGDQFRLYVGILASANETAKGNGTSEDTSFSVEEVVSW